MGIKRPQRTSAKRFAEIDPVPALDWLKPLEENRYTNSNLLDFGINTKTTLKEKLEFSLVSRPTPYTHSSWMTLVDNSQPRNQLDNIMFYIAHWLIRHLGNTELIFWLAKKGGQLNNTFKSLINRRLSELANLTESGNLEELDRIRSSAPDSIPDQQVLILWRLVLTGRLKSWGKDVEFYDWQERFKRDGITTTLRMELKELLTPYISLKAPFKWLDDSTQNEKARRLKDVAEWEIELTVDHAQSSFNEIFKDPKWIQALPLLLLDFNILLKDVLDLMNELGEVDERNDLSYIFQPSISKHSQNNDFHNWTLLIELTRDAWIETAKQDTGRARRIAEIWWDEKYPLFRRLTFFAAAYENIITGQLALEWLLSDNQWWLWSIITKREAIRLIVSLDHKLDKQQIEKLEKAILHGPPRKMFGDDIDDITFNSIVDQEVWVRLSKLAAVVDLNKEAKERLKLIKRQNPEWQLTKDEKEEFSSWIGTGDEFVKFTPTPTRRKELIRWIIDNPKSDRWNKDDWSKRCRENFLTALTILRILARENIWPVDRWRQAFQAWTEEKYKDRSWRFLAPILLEMPEESFKELIHSISGWLETISKSFLGNEQLFFELCQLVLLIDYKENEISDEPLTQAINHPVGHIVEALIHWWYRKSPQDNQGLPKQLSTILTDITDTKIRKYRFGRIILAINLIALFRVDPDWVMKNLIRIFEWQRSEEEACLVWTGFLWTPRIYFPLMNVLKKSLLETAFYCEELGKVSNQYSRFLTFISLDPGDIFNQAELRKAIRALPPKELKEVIQALKNALESAGSQHDKYWNNRIVPFLKKIWPKSKEIITPEISQNIGHLCIAANKSFPEAFMLLSAWLQPIQRNSYLINQLVEAEHCRNFPKISLNFLDKIIDASEQWISSKLRDCLNTIRSADPDLEQNPKFQNLVDILHLHGKDLD